MSERPGPVDCAAMDDYAEEFALGLLDGAERAAVVAHLEGCRACGAQVAFLAETGEQLLLIAPSVEPPAGFEERVLAQVVPQAVRLTQRHRAFQRQRVRWLGRRLAIAAMVVLVIGLAALAVGLVRDERPAEAVAAIMGAHDEGRVGEMTVIDSDPMVVEIDMAEWLAELETWDNPPKGPWVLTVDRVDGRHEEHTVAFGRDTTPRVTLGPGDQAVREIAVEDGGGHVWCSATFEDVS